MKRTDLLPTLLAAVLAAPACKKDGAASTTPPAEEGQDAAATSADDEPEDPPQDPDPAELTAAFETYLRGDPQAVVASLEPAIAGWTGDGKIRARAMGQALLALARAEDVVEQAQSHAEAAVAEAGRLHDPQVTALARAAAGVYALGVEDFDTAVTELSAAAEARAPAATRALVSILLGQALIGRAYGPGGGSKLQNPEDLDRAKAAYAAALEAAAGSPQAALLEGRAHEGLAAVAKYQGDHDALCEHARAAGERLAAGDATDRLAEGPRLLAEAGRCTDG